MLCSFNMKEIKKTLFIFLLISFCGGGSELSYESSAIEENLTTTSITASSTTTTTLLQEEALTLDDYLGEAFVPAYSPNELLFFEKNMNDNYFSNTRNKLIEESLINLTITETTKYKNTVILGDDVVCEKDTYIMEDANEVGMTPEEYCNKLVTVSDWNYIRYPGLRYFYT